MFKHVYETDENGNEVLRSGETLRVSEEKGEKLKSVRERERERERERQRQRQRHEVRKRKLFFCKCELRRLRERHLMSKIKRKKEIFLNNYPLRHTNVFHIRAS